jgi:hypothetical protein
MVMMVYIIFFYLSQRTKYTYLLLAGSDMMTSLNGFQSHDLHCSNLTVRKNVQCQKSFNVGTLVCDTLTTPQGSVSQNSIDVSGYFAEVIDVTNANTSFELNSHKNNIWLKCSTTVGDNILDIVLPSLDEGETQIITISRSNETGNSPPRDITVSTRDPTRDTFYGDIVPTDILMLEHDNFGKLQIMGRRKPDGSTWWLIISADQTWVTL